jgi:putative ABC transport system permease protein
VSFADAAQFAWTALSRQRRRSVLSVLGVTVGVAAVVILTALGEGARRYVVQEFASLGTNLLIVFPGKNETTGMFPGVGGVPNDLTLDDAAALAREVREARLVVPISMGNETVSHGERRRQLIVRAVRAFPPARRDGARHVGGGGRGQGGGGAVRGREPPGSRDAHR